MRSIPDKGGYVEGEFKMIFFVPGLGKQKR